MGFRGTGRANVESHHKEACALVHFYAGKALSCQTDDSPVQSHTTNRDLGLQDKNEVSLETDPPPLEEIYPLNSAGQPR